MLKRTDTKERGQSLVEFALLLPVLIFIMMGLLDVGRAYFAYVALEEAAIEAAQYMAFNPHCPDAAAGAECADPNNAIWRAENSFNREVPPGTLTFTWQADPIAIGSPVTVTFVYDFQLLTPVVPQWVGGSDTIRLSASSASLIINDPD